MLLKVVTTNSTKFQFCQSVDTCLLNCRCYVQRPTKCNVMSFSRNLAEQYNYFDSNLSFSFALVNIIEGCCFNNHNTEIHPPNPVFISRMSNCWRKMLEPIIKHYSSKNGKFVLTRIKSLLFVPISSIFGRNNARICTKVK